MLLDDSGVIWFAQQQTGFGAPGMFLSATCKRTHAMTVRTLLRTSGNGASMLHAVIRAAMSPFVEMRDGYDEEEWAYDFRCSLTHHLLFDGGSGQFLSAIFRPNAIDNIVCSEHEIKFVLTGGLSSVTFQQLRQKASPWAFAGDWNALVELIVRESDEPEDSWRAEHRKLILDENPEIEWQVTEENCGEVATRETSPLSPD
jgi:hypothetical protein